MRKILYCNLVYIAFSLCLLLSMSFINIADAELNNESKFNMLNNCANEESALTRLECYDRKNSVLKITLKLLLTYLIKEIVFC